MSLEEDIKIENQPVNVSVVLNHGELIVFEMYLDKYYGLLTYIKDNEKDFTFLEETSGDIHFINLSNISTITTHPLGETLLGIESGDYYDEF